MKPFVMPAVLEIGNKLIDNQHQSVVDYIVSLGMRDGAVSSRPDLEARLGQLHTLVREHFRAEESIMRFAGFYGLPEHIALHETCLSLLDGNIARIVENSTISDPDVADLFAVFLKDVFKGDLKFQEFLACRKSQKPRGRFPAGSSALIMNGHRR